MNRIVDYVDAKAKVEQPKTLFAGYFDKYDVLLCPVNPHCAASHLPYSSYCYVIKVLTLDVDLIITAFQQVL